MKINTKKTTPVSKTVSPVIMKNDNKNIPQSRLDKENDDGREVMYEPTIVFTPVLSSDRTHRAAPNRPRFTLSAMDEVCAMLMKMFIKEAAVKDDTKQDQKDKALVANEELGRIKMSVMSPKSNSSVEVLRSARLVEA